MKFFKNHAVAMVITILTIAGCCVVGFLTKPDTSVADMTALEYGKENYGAYLEWIDDQADLLSAKTEQEIATYMAAMDHGYGSIVAVVTTKNLGATSIDEYAYNVAVDAKLSGMDMILLLDKESDNWYMQPGADIEHYLDSKLQATVTAALSGSVVQGADKALPNMFRDMFNWYEANLSPVDSDGSGTAFVLGLIAFILIFSIVFGSMGVGYRRYGYGFWGPFWGPIFYPHRFPGGPHSRGYHHRHDPRYYTPPRPTAPHRDDHDDHGFGGFGGGGFGGGGRGGGFGGGGGGFGGGGFGGGGRGGGFGGGGGGFGGGGFGGGGRGGGFGG